MPGVQSVTPPGYLMRWTHAPVMIDAFRHGRRNWEVYWQDILVSCCAVSIPLPKITLLLLWNKSTFDASSKFGAKYRNEVLSGWKGALQPAGELTQTDDPVLAVIGKLAK